MTAPSREDLRRRLYRPGAGGQDLAAYLATVEPEPEAVPSRPVARPRRRRWAGAAAGVVALLVLLGVVRAFGAGATTEAVPAAVPTPAASLLPTVPVEADSRSVFLRNLLDGRDAGLLAWLAGRGWTDRIPDDRMVEAHGTGDGVVVLPRVDGSGPVVVLLVATQDGVATWSTARLVLHDDRTVHLEAMSTRTGALLAGVPAWGRADSDGGAPPVRVLVDLPPDVTWGLAAVVRP